ncbi:DUF7848 domain-containing protein [Streptomyces hydrogenans]|uniref:DUF7848 domain-containing protein n=1 Tax=Streptomyces hydrogenans TaxID=1873719 RepID=UPI0035DAF992
MSPKTVMRFVDYRLQRADGPPTSVTYTCTRSNCGWTSGRLEDVDEAADACIRHRVESGGHSIFATAFEDLAIVTPVP